MNTSSEISQVCMEFLIPDGIKVVIARPYIPWIPKNWNGLLVLAEAQNLSKTNIRYVERLTDLPPKEQVRRLYLTEQPSDLGIAPWDDGSLKLAVEAAFGEDANRTAVSNAVLWSQVTESNANMTPSPHLISTSAELWSMLLPVLQPHSVITAGNVAHQVINSLNDKINQSFEHYKLRLPAKTAMSRVSGMFELKDLLLRYPEVARVKDKYVDCTTPYAQNKIFFACHAVSLHGTKRSSTHTHNDIP